MASEKDRWWCEECRQWEDIWDHLPCRKERMPVYVPAAALDAHTAEVVERCETIVQEVFDHYHLGRHVDAKCDILDAIRALAPRKEDV